MPVIIGFIIVIASVLGGYVLSHGKLLALWQPFELIIIGGSAFGAFVVANPAKVIKASFKGFFQTISGSPYNKKFYMDLFGLLFQIANKIRKTGLMSIEEDVDNPDKSATFKKYPKILKDGMLINFLSDNLRVIISGNLTVFEFEALLDREIDTLEAELEKPVHAVTKVSDALPGFGIVAAVLGIVITMSLIGGDPKTLGVHVAAALVGTFLGILFAYGFVGPVADAMHHLAVQKLKVMEMLKVFLLSLSAGTPPRVAVEYSRRILFSDVKPGFLELEEFVKKLEKE